MNYLFSMLHTFHNYPIIFTHSSRTGGGCLMLVMERQYKNSQIFPFYVWKKGGTTQDALESFVNMPPEKKAKYKVLGGHVPFGLHKFYDQYSYLTLFRDPVKRIISLYSLALSDTGYYLHNIVVSNNMSLKEFVASGISPELNNGQVRMLGGFQDIRFNHCTRDMLEMAKLNFDYYYPVFGITERYDESVLLMQQYYGWATPYYQSRNTSKSNLSNISLSQDTLDVISHTNSLDIELYQYANRRLDSLIEAQGPYFKSKLQVFINRNRLLQKYSNERNRHFAFALLNMYSKIKR